MHYRITDFISFAGLDRVREAILLGMYGGKFWLGGWVVGPERFNQLPDGVASPNFQERYLVSQG